MPHHFNHNLEQNPPPTFFVRSSSPLARLVFFSTLSLVLMAVDSRLQYLASVRQNMQVILYPLQLLAITPSRTYREVSDYLSTHVYLVDENKRLTKEALNQAVKLQKLNALELENAHLRQLLQADQSAAQTTISAEIMYVSRDLFTKKIIVNRGARHHVVAGQAVVDEAGVIGQVTRIYPLSSEVTLITEKSLSIPVQVERNGLRVIAFGHGRDNTLDLPYLPTNVDIKEGDKLVTSGIDGIYPTGLTVATIAKIELTPGSPFAHIVCIPAGGVEKHKQVLLLGIVVPAQVADPVFTEEVRHDAPPQSQLVGVPGVAPSQANVLPNQLGDAPHQPTQISTPHAAQ